MKPIILNAEYMVSPEEIPDVEDVVEIHFTRFGRNQLPGGEPHFVNPKAYKIFCHINEPTTSRWVEPVNNIIKHHKQYDKIVTSNDEVIKNCSNSKFLPYGTTWLNKSPHHPDSFGKFSENLGNIPKSFSLSMICGHMYGKMGYNIRHAIFSNQHMLTIPRKFYSSTRFPIDGYETLPNDDKIHLFDSMYSVVIESSQEKNYFTEKIIDCLITKTIPVYWGCPNISDFFDTSYWINVDNVFRHNYTIDQYSNNIDKINSNFKIAKKYCENFFKRIMEV